MKSKYIYFILFIIALIVFIIFLFRKSSNLSNYNKELIDSVYIYKNKLNESYKAKDLAIKSLDDVLEINNELSEEIKYLKDHPIIVTKTEVEFVKEDIQGIIDSIRTSIENEERIAYWHASDSIWYSMNGTIHESKDSLSININNLKTYSGIWFDVIENGNKMTVLARTENPYEDIKDINTVMIDLNESKYVKSLIKPKKWHLGPSVSAGMIGNSNRLDFGFSIGISLTYSLWSF